METEEARASYRRRGRVVEFCHAWIKSKLGLRQFHVRGLVKVQMEMLWACLTYNLQQWIRLRKPLAAAATGEIQKTGGSGKDGIDTSSTGGRDKIFPAPQKPTCARRFFTASFRKVRVHTLRFRAPQRSKLRESWRVAHHSTSPKRTPWGINDADSTLSHTAIFRCLANWHAG
jgi:hypothetical protein